MVKDKIIKLRVTDYPQGNVDTGVLNKIYEEECHLIQIIKDKKINIKIPMKIMYTEQFE